MQAIVTKFIGPTNTRPSRIKALAEAGSLTVAWDYGLSTDRNHAAAAKALRDKLGWTGRLIGGGMPQASSHHMAFVFDNALSEVIEA